MARLILDRKARPRNLGPHAVMVLLVYLDCFEHVNDTAPSGIAVHEPYEAIDIFDKRALDTVKCNSCVRQVYDQDDVGARPTPRMILRDGNDKTRLQRSRARKKSALFGGHDMVVAEQASRLDLTV